MLVGGPLEVRLNMAAEIFRLLQLNSDINNTPNFTKTEAKALAAVNPKP